MVICWIILWKRYFLLSLIFILLGWNVLTQHFGFSSDCGTVAENAFKIMSYNVHNLANNNLHIQNENHRKKIFNTILSEKPDIVCIQEFYYSGSRKEELIDGIKKSLNLPNSYRRNYYQNINKIDALIIFTRYPIINKGFIKNNKGKTLLIFTDLIIDKDTIRLVNMHLQSYSFNKEDLEIVKEFGKSATNDELKESSKNIIRRLYNAFVLRSAEAGIFRQFIESSQYPLIICGDLNDTPSSYAYHVVSNDLNDSFERSGSGIAKTYTESPLPLRIDYILYDDKFTSCNYKTHEAYHLSDHYPVSCYLSIN